MWECVCDCGNKCTVRGTCLKRGETKSCGCWRKEASLHRTFAEGYTSRDRLSLRDTWYGILRRCEDPDNPAYHRYGGRGIKVCKEWHNHLVFRDWAIKNGYRRGMEIDRINNDGDYCPENCHFVTPRENANNRANTVKVEYNGEMMPISYVAEKVGISRQMLYRRVKRGVCKEDLFKKEKLRRKKHG